MREPRNPFRLRAAEQIESDLSFLRLFGPGTLEMLGAEEIWDRPQILRSAAGGGKTSLLKLLTPNILLALHGNRANDDVKELYQRLSEYGIVAESGPKALGVFLQCNRNYATLDDLDFETTRKTHLFLSLINARVVLAALRAALALSGLRFPAELSRITLKEDANVGVIGGTNGSSGGEALYEWATRCETELCDAVDSFDPPDQSALARQDSIVGAELLRPGVLRVDGKPVSERSVLMFDDVHLLTHQQRSSLVRSFAQVRSPLAVWMAERFEALTPDELLSSGATQGRDFNVIQIEQFWRRQRKKFQNLAFNIADRRARAATEVEFPSFEPYLVSSLDGSEWQERAVAILDEVERRVRAQVADDKKFDDWLEYDELKAGTTLSRAVGWRTLEVLIERERRRTQGTFDFALSTDELDDKSDSQVKAAAELFLAFEHKLPYYFGPSRLAALASSNLEQFLWLAGDEFEELIASAIVRQPKLQLPPERQDLLIRRASSSLWRQIPRRARFGDRVAAFLDSVGRFCRQTTFQPNAPYDPGVTGIAISMADRNKLLDASYIKRYPDHRRLAEVLAASIASNLLEPVLDYKCKGTMWMVLNLNRLLCPEHWLPLQYGGFREKSLDELSRWVSDGYKVPPATEALL